MILLHVGPHKGFHWNFVYTEDLFYSYGCLICGIYPIHSDDRKWLKSVAKIGTRPIPSRGKDKSIFILNSVKS